MKTIKNDKNKVPNPIKDFEFYLCVFNAFAMMTVLLLAMSINHKTKNG